MPYTTKQNLLAGVTVTTTSSGVYIGDRTKLSVQVAVSQIAAGSASFKLQVSNDNKTWTDYNRLISNIAAGTAFTTANLDTNVTELYFFPAGDHFEYVRAVFGDRNATGIIVTATVAGVIAGQ